MIRLFVGVDLPADVRMRLSALGAGVPGARWVPPENLHLTLRFIGEVTETDAEDIHDALLAPTRRLAGRVRIIPPDHADQPASPPLRLVA